MKGVPGVLFRNVLFPVRSNVRVRYIWDPSASAIIYIEKGWFEFKGNLVYYHYSWWYKANRGTVIIDIQFIERIRNSIPNPLNCDAREGDVDRRIIYRLI